MRYKYTVCSTQYAAQIQGILDNYANEGWELVTVTVSSHEEGGGLGGYSIVIWHNLYWRAPLPELAAQS